MPEIIGAELQIDRLISADPANGVVAALDSSGAAVNLIAYGQGTGDVTYSAPTGNTTNTRTHRFDRPIVSTSTAQFAGSVITDAATAARRGFLINISGAYVAGIDADAATGEVRIGGMSVADYFPLFFSDGVERARIGIGGQFLVGTVAIGSVPAGGIRVQARSQFLSSFFLGGSDANMVTNDGSATAGTFCLGNTSAPIANPVGAGFLWVEAGALKYRGTSGTVTTVGAA